jgi:3-demethylubiquinone-9 3-methyltransferase
MPRPRSAAGALPCATASPIQRLGTVRQSPACGGAVLHLDLPRFPHHAGRPPLRPRPAIAFQNRLGVTIEFELLSRPFVALNGGPSFTFSQGISIFVQCDRQNEAEQKEADEYWDKFVKSGGHARRLRLDH